MIKRIKIPDPITLEAYCDKNDLTIILTSYHDKEGNPRVKAKLQGSSVFYVSEKEWFALVELAKKLSSKIIVINGKRHEFPILRCY